MRLLLGIDAGNHRCKIIGEYGEDDYHTNICAWFERNVKETFAEDDMVFEIDGQKGFAGTIAKYEDEFGTGNMYGDTKAHKDTKIRVLLGIYRYMKKYQLHESDVSIIVGQPIGQHNEDHKGYIKRMLKGYHDYTVNGERIELTINEVEVTAEGGAAYWLIKEKNLLRVIDIGSGTINVITIINGKIINKLSRTLEFGTETVSDRDGIVDGIIRNVTAMKWKPNDKVYLCGGIAEQVIGKVKKHFLNASLIKPEVDHRELGSVFTNAASYYEIAKKVYG